MLILILSPHALTDVSAWTQVTPDKLIAIIRFHNMKQVIMDYCLSVTSRWLDFGQVLMRALWTETQMRSINILPISSHLDRARKGFII